MNDSPHPQADALAVVWMRRWPDDLFWCEGCHKEYHVGGPACPRCGHIENESSCRALLAMYAQIPEPAGVEEPELPPPPAAPATMLDDVIGNSEAVAQLRMFLDGFAFDLAQPGASKGMAFPHTILSGPGGTGKTMLAEVIARELKRPIHLHLGQTLNTPDKIARELLSLKAGDVLFVDEIHQLPPRCQEALYRAMEDGVLIPVTKAGKTSKPVRLPPFTLIGATTDLWGLLPSMCQRFKYRIELARMTADEIARALAQRAARSKWDVAPDAIAMIGQRSLGTPRLAVGLLDACMVAAKAEGGQRIGPEIVAIAFSVMGIDALGLNQTARRYLGILDDGGPGPVRLNVISSKLDGLSKTTVERKIEPDLVFLGLVDKLGTGRALTQAGRDHLRG